MHSQSTSRLFIAAQLAKTEIRKHPVAIRKINAMRFGGQTS